MPIVLDYAADGAIIGGYFYAFIPDGAIETGAWQVVLTGAVYARQVHIVDPAAQVHGFLGHVGDGQMGVTAPSVEPVQEMLQMRDGGELGEEALVFSGEGQQPQQLVDKNPNSILPPLNPTDDLRVHSPPPQATQNPDIILPLLSSNPDPNTDSGSRARPPSPAPTKPSKRRRVTRTNNNTTVATNTPNINKRSLVVKLPIAVNVNEVTGIVSIANSVARKRRLLREEREVASMERQEGAKRKVVRAGDESETDLGGKRK